MKLCLDTANGNYFTIDECPRVKYCGKEVWISYVCENNEDNGEYVARVSNGEIDAKTKLRLPSVDMRRFVHHREITYDLWVVFIKLLGYIPFAKKVGSKYVYDNIQNISKTLTQDFSALHKPNTTTNFLGHEIPTAIFRKMKTINHMMEDLDGSLDRTSYDVQLKIPNISEDDIYWALEKLTQPDYGRCCARLSDMIVYDFLNVLDIFKYRNGFFINGDEIIEYTSLNLLRNGYFNISAYQQHREIDSRYQTKKYEFVFTIREDSELLTDNMIEASDTYWDIYTKLGDGVTARVTALACRNRLVHM